MLPDDKRFGVFWMGYTELAAAFDMEGAFNDVAADPDARGRPSRRCSAGSTG